jgi:hypothetical protein
LPDTTSVEPDESLKDPGAAVTETGAGMTGSAAIVERAVGGSAVPHPMRDDMTRREYRNENLE